MMIRRSRAIGPVVVGYPALLARLTTVTRGTSYTPEVDAGFANATPVVPLYEAPEAVGVAVDNGAESGVGVFVAPVEEPPLPPPIEELPVGVTAETLPAEEASDAPATEDAPAAPAASDPPEELTTETGPVEASVTEAPVEAAPVEEAPTKPAKRGPKAKAAAEAP